MTGINTTGKPKSAQGGGVIIGSRDRDGRLHMAGKPFEHRNLQEAALEAERLAKKHPGREFVVFAVVAGRIEDKVTSNV